ncbi:MAG TPA: hypothetical protein VGB70_12740 [Allosphingosinicella sp.]|jgi:hypothetical protein
MAEHNSVQAAAKAAGKKLDGAINGGSLRRFQVDVNLAAQASGDTINLLTLPRGYRFAYGVLNSDTSLGASTLAIGVAADPAKFRAAAIFTATDTPTLFGKQAPTREAEGDEQAIIATVGAAALPGAGNLTIDIYASERG